MERQEILATIAGRLAAAQRVFVLTGAGLGVASGLGTFRGPDGYWRNHSFEQLASLDGFRADPALVWTWYNERIAAYLAASPNAGHMALAELQALMPQLVIATQNVDGLHARAGSRNVLEIHGSIFDVKCTGNCVSRETSFERLDGPFDLAHLQHDGCGGMRRPGVVWFGNISRRTHCARLRNRVGRPTSFWWPARRLRWNLLRAWRGNTARKQSSWRLIQSRPFACKPT